MTQYACKKLEQAEYMRTIHHDLAVAGTPPEAVLDPKYWMHVARDLKPQDRIEVYAEDGSYFLELMVIYTGRYEAKVQLLSKHDLALPIPEEISDSPYEVKWAGRAKWRVIRKADRAPVRDGFQDRESAQLWAAAHAKAA